MPRKLETETLHEAAKAYAGAWLVPTVISKTGNPVWGRGWVEHNVFNATFKDEFGVLVENMKGWMGPKALVEFEAHLKTLPPREDKVFVDLLKRKLAIDPDGNHLEGCVGTTKVGSRFVGTRQIVYKHPKWGEIFRARPQFWHVYAGEAEERKAGNPNLDPLPKDADPWPVEILQANNPNWSAEAAIAALDALTGRFDEGSTAAEIRGRTGTQPADPDAAESGTLLFTCTMSDPAFNSAVDDTDGTCSATADTISDDTSADATNTLAYCRVAATGTGADDHLDIEAGTTGSDINFNTVSIVSGATVSITSFVLNLSQGSSAT